MAQQSKEWQEKYQKAKDGLFRQFNDARLDFDRKHGIVRSVKSRNVSDTYILELVYELMDEYPREDVPATEPKQ